SLTVSATDADGDSLTYSATGLPQGLTINSGTGEISGTLGGQSAGTYTVKVTASDGVNSDSATFGWVVADVTTPHAPPPANQDSRAGDTISGVSASATDSDGDTLTFSASNLPSGLSIDSNTGAISGTIAAQTQGTFTVQVSVSDGQNTGTASFTWVVHDVV